MVLKRYAVIELEEGSLTLTIAVVSKSKCDISTCRRVPLRELSHPAVSSVLRSLLAEVDERVEDVHVVLGERRFQHLITELPRLDADDLRQVIKREAYHLGSIAPDSALLAHAWTLRRLPGRRQRVAAIALADQVWQPLNAAFEENRLRVVSLTSLEDAIATSMPVDAPSNTAVLEISAGKARLVLCENRAVIRERRFMLPNSRGDESEMLAAQLAMEVPRTLDYLREIGCLLPEVILVSHRVPLSSDQLESLIEGVGRFEKHSPPFALAEAEAVPSLGTLGVLSRLGRAGGRTLSVLGGVSVDVPRSPLRVLAAGLAIAVCGVGAWFGSGIYHEVNHHAARHEELSFELQKLDGELGRLVRASEEEVPLSSSEARVHDILQTRRPYSLLLASLANATPDSVDLGSVAFDANDRIAVTGSVHGGSRLRSLDVFREFAQSVEKTELVARRGSERFKSGAAVGSNALEFEMDLAWRGR